MNNFIAWKQTRSGLLITAVVELGLAYIFASLAFDSAHFWQYGLAILFLAGATHSVFKIVRNGR